MTKATLWRIVRRTMWSLLLVGTVGGGAGWWWYSHTPKYHWQRAARSLKNEDWPAAEIHLKNVIAVAPQDVEARVSLANVTVTLANQGKEKPLDVDPPAAMEQLVEVARIEPKNAAVRERLLRNYMRTARADAASAIARELAELGSTNGDTLFLAANVELNEKRWAEADGLIERFGEKVTRLAPMYLTLKVRLLEGQDDREGLDKLLGPTLRQMAQTLDAGRRPLTANERRALGTVFSAAIRYSPRDAAERRLLNSLTILERVAAGDKDPAIRAELVGIAANLLHVLDTVHTQPIAATKINNPAETRRTALQKLQRFAEPTLKAGQATPLVYEQLARAAVQLQDDVRAIALLQTGIELHRQLPEERQREVLALQWQAAVRLVTQRRFAEASRYIPTLLKETETSPIGHLLAGVVAAEEGRLETAQQHLAEIESRGGVVVNALRLRVLFAARQWQPALELSEQLDSEWDKLSASETKWLTETQGGREQLELRQAVCWLALNEPEQARPILQRLDMGPLREKARLLRVIDLTRSQQRKEAWDVLRLARRDAPADFKLLIAEFSLLLQDGAVDGATRLLTGHLQRQPRDLSARLLLARWLSQRGDVPAALRELAEARRISPDAEAPCFMTADLLISAGRGDELKKLLVAMQAQPALATLVPLVQAHWNLRQAGLTEAADALQQATPELKRRAGFPITSAAIAWGQQDAPQAFEHIAESLEFTGTRPVIRDDFLKAFAAALQTADPKTINARVERLLTTYPEEPVVLLAAAEMATRRGDSAAALERIDRLEKVDVMPGRAAYTRARLLALLGRGDESLAEANRVLIVAPEYSAARLLAAQLEFSHREYTRVLDHLKAMPSSLADGIEVVLLRTAALAKLDRTAEAKLLLEDLIKRQPQQPQPYLALASLCETSGQATQAIETIERGLVKLPQQPQLQEALLKLLVRSGKSTEAVEAAQRFAGLSPKDADCLRLARVFLAVQQFETAGVWLQRARAAVTEKPSAELLFLEALLPQQQGTQRHEPELLAEARRKYDELLKQSPGYVPALNNLAWLLAADMNQPAEAFAVAEQLRAAVATERLGADLLDTLAEVYRRSGHQREALDLVSESLTRFPNSAILRYQHAAALLATSDEAQPRELARRELALAKEWGVPAHRAADLDALLVRMNAE